MLRISCTICLLVLMWMEAGYAQAPQWQDYFLLPSGSHFSYETHIKSLFRRHDGTITIRQSGTVRIGKYRYQKNRLTGRGLAKLPMPDVNYVRADRKGIYTRASADPRRSDRLKLPLPPSVGRRWTMRADGVTYHNILASLGPCRAIGRTFPECIKIVSTGTKKGVPVRVVWYYAPGVGLVSMHLSSKIGVDISMKLQGK